MDLALCEAMETFSLDFDDSHKYVNSKLLDPVTVLHKIKSGAFRRGAGVKSPVSMHPTSRSCDILTTQFGRGLEGMGQHYYYDSENSDNNVWKFHIYKKDVGWIRCEFLFYPDSFTIRELITGCQGSYYVEIKYLQDYTFEFLK